MPTRNRTVLHLTQTMIGALLVTGSLAAQAANLGFLHDTPISNMTQADIDSLKAAAFNALDKQKDGDTVTWTNEGSRNSVRVNAQMTIQDTATEGTSTCRTVRVVLNARGQSMNLGPRYCRQGTTGKWVLQRRH
ncbi:hypothetical protein [Paraburkholderia rhizosphaerae]|uniref:Outer membrane surface antigen n=1 Tax=Paraburkholderia rhizosphaerae TaxID=480658 RepID=A0A4R8LN32_9BURK|nr:hypothetical protein [Paraburkholderia rhizosphaerae]TDY47668.1 hypothetical protein BX592_11253 [Paraburkholderia rhizosphaerae]